MVSDNYKIFDAETRASTVPDQLSVNCSERTLHTVLAHRLIYRAQLRPAPHPPHPRRHVAWRHCPVRHSPPVYTESRWPQTAAGCYKACASATWPAAAPRIAAAARRDRVDRSGILRIRFAELRCGLIDGGTTGCQLCVHCTTPRFIGYEHSSGRTRSWVTTASAGDCSQCQPLRKAASP